MLICPDVDEATLLFTDKFRSILDYHIPWIIYQQRKFHKPWISKETLALMTQKESLPDFILNIMWMATFKEVIVYSPQIQMVSLTAVH